MKFRIEIKSLVFGIMFGTIVTLLIGAAERQPPVPVLTNIRCAVMDITPVGDLVRGKQRVIVHLERFYGKIDQESLDFRSKHETQELTIATTLDQIPTLKTNEIITFQAFDDGVSIWRHTN